MPPNNLRKSVAVSTDFIRFTKMNELEAYRAVQESYLSKALQRDRDYVEHDTVEEWAEFIHNEINQPVMLRI